MLSTKNRPNRYIYEWIVFFILSIICIIIVVFIGRYEKIYRIEISYWDKEKGIYKCISCYDIYDNEHGIGLTWHKNGVLKSYTIYEHGEIEEIILWYSNGMRKSIQKMDDGIGEGEWIWWDRNGEILARSDFIDGTGREYYFTDNGDIRVILSWKSGKLDGECYYFDNRGDIRCVRIYKKGKLKKEISFNVKDRNKMEEYKRKIRKFWDRYKY